jgi:hypothetical protein
MASKISKQLMKGFKDITKRLEASVAETLSPNTQKIIGAFALNLIVKRTRLGYGVKENFGERYRFPKHSPAYIVRRRSFAGLSGTTSPSKSNLTFTGQLLESTKVIKVEQGKIFIGPSGRRDEGRLTNPGLAAILEEKGRVYNRVSQNEFNQILRFYRKTFGDLLRKRKLIS